MQNFIGLKMLHQNNTNHLIEFRMTLPLYNLIIEFHKLSGSHLTSRQMKNNLLSFHSVKVPCIGSEAFNNSKYKDGGTSYSSLYSKINAALDYVKKD